MRTSVPRSRRRLRPPSATALALALPFVGALCPASFLPRHRAGFHPHRGALRRLPQRAYSADELDVEPTSSYEAAEQLAASSPAAAVAAELAPSTPAVGGGSSALDVEPAGPDGDEDEDEDLKPLAGSGPGEEKPQASPTQHYLSSLSRVDDYEVPVLEAALRNTEDDWLQNMLTFPTSRVLRRVWRHVLFNAFTACGIAALSASSPRAMTMLRIPLAPHSLMGSFIGVFLAFRTSHANMRYHEGRNVWTSIFTSIRDFSRGALGYANDENDLLGAVVPDLDQQRGVWMSSMRLLAAYPVALKQHLRGQRNLAEFNEVLSATELDYLSRDENLPVAVCSMLTTNITPMIHPQAKLNAMYVFSTTFEPPVQVLIDAVGKAEQLVRTPVPQAYSHHTSRFLTMWTVTLPFALLGSCGVVTMPLVSAFCSWALFGAEELGHIVEEPMGASLSAALQAKGTVVVKAGGTSSAAGESDGESAFSVSDKELLKYGEVLPLERYARDLRLEVSEVAEQLPGGTKYAPGVIVAKEKSSQSASSGVTTIARSDEPKKKWDGVNRAWIEQGVVGQG